MPERQALVELLLLLLVLEWHLWTDSKRVLPPAARAAGAVFVILAVGVLLFFQKPSLRDLGLAPQSWRDGLGSLAWFTVPACAFLLAIGSWTDNLGNLTDFWGWVNDVWYLEGAQQLLLNVLVAPRLAILFGGFDSRVFMLSAVIFSLVHAPNLPLMALTFPAGYFWASWFHRHRNLPALWLSHMALAASVVYSLNGPALRMLRVGIAYVLFRG